MSTINRARMPESEQPLLRLYCAPEERPLDTYSTVRDVYDALLASEIPPKSVRDCERYLGYFGRFCEEQDVLDPRSGRPWVLISEVTTALVTAFRDWMVSESGLNLSNSTANKAAKLLKRIVDTAGEEGISVRRVRTKSLPAAARPKYYLDDSQIAAIWEACESAVWPTRNRRRSFLGTGLTPPTWWRCVLILARCYGMRVQDLVSYSRDKIPATWASVHRCSRTPDPDGRAEFQGGWFTYTANKTGRRYTLPLVDAAKAAIDRLEAAACAQLGCTPEALPMDRPILPCPKGHGLGSTWRQLQTQAGVSAAKGVAFQLEDFRKTAATYLAEHHSELPFLVCGWSTARSAVASKHYIHAERTLVAHLPTAPLPACFKAWYS